jgi:hypothetical protein
MIIKYIDIFFQFSFEWNEKNINFTFFEVALFFIIKGPKWSWKGYLKMENNFMDRHFFSWFANLHAECLDKEIHINGLN